MIHRIIEIDDEGLIATQGDNRDTPDQWKLTTDDIVGRPVLHVPHGGHVVWYLQQGWVIALVCGMIAMALLWPSRPESEEDADESMETVRGPVYDAEREPTPAIVDRQIADTTDTVDDITGRLVRPDPWIGAVTDALPLPTSPRDDFDDRHPAAEPWSDKHIDQDVMDEAMAWLDEQLDGIAGTPAR